MEYKPKNREWVKNAAIIFLSVLLVLTFFSNTWMNRSLPEVATQYVTSGAITAKVRGSGVVTAVGTTTVKADATRDIRAVMVKVGQEVQAGDVLFVLGQGETSELEAAQETLRQLQINYQRAAVGILYPDYSLQEHQIAQARDDVNTAREELASVMKRISTADLPNEQLEEAKAQLQAAAETLLEKQKRLDEIQAYYDGLIAVYGPDMASMLENIESVIALQEEKTNKRIKLLEVEKEWADLERRYQEATDETEKERLFREKSAKYDEMCWLQTEVDCISDVLADAMYQGRFGQLQIAKKEVEDAQAALGAAQSKYDSILATIEEIIGKDVLNAEYVEAQKKLKDAEDRLFTLEYELKQKKASDSQSQQLDYVTLSDIGAQIDNAKKKVADLAGGDENQVVAKAAGTVQTIECAPGDTKLKGDVLCTIEVPDMGYTMSFSVTNDQARRLKPGDTATVSNYYWGNQITATLESIKTDPKNPQTNKVLTFDLSGDVSAGSELTLSVGQKSANYDVVVPNSSIRSDTNGSFVLTIESKNSPLGNRYIARRVDVSVLAEDDINSAVTADLSYGDYVITTSNAPVKSGDMVRLADN